MTELAAVSTAEAIRRLTAPDARGPWLPAGNLPTGFAALPNDRNFADVKQQIPGRALTPATTPTVFVSTTPAAIIVSTGAPQYAAIAGTSLSYVTNTDAALFRDASGRFYYLVSGRWFAAPSLDGPWTFATASLPPDFKRIPADGPRGQYWTGDRELSPLSSYLLGGRFIFKKTADQQKKFGNVLYSFETSFSFDLMKTSLKEFTWGGTKPDDTLALIGSLGVRAVF